MILPITPGKRTGPFIWTNLHLIHPRMLCTIFGWYWPCCSTASLIFPLRKGRALCFSKLESATLKDTLCQVWLKFSPWFWRRKFLKIPFKYIFSIWFVSPLGKGRFLPLNKLEIPSPKEDLSQVWLKLAQCFACYFLNFVNVFTLFWYYIPLKIGGALHLNKLESPSPKDAMSSLVDIGSGEEDFLHLSMYFRYFVTIYPYKKTGSFIWWNFPSPKDGLCHVLLALWFWRRFLKFVNIFLIFRKNLPLGKSGTLHLKRLESPSPKDALCQHWLNLAQWFWRRLLFQLNRMYFRNFVFISPW